MLSYVYLSFMGYPINMRELKEMLKEKKKKKIDKEEEERI